MRFGLLHTDVTRGQMRGKSFMDESHLSCDPDTLRWLAHQPETPPSHCMRVDRRRTDMCLKHAEKLKHRPGEHKFRRRLSKHPVELSACHVFVFLTVVIRYCVYNIRKKS